MPSKVVIGKNYPDLSFSSSTEMHDWCLWLNSHGLASTVSLPNEGSVWTHLRNFINAVLTDHRWSYEGANGPSQGTEDSDEDGGLSSAITDRFDTLMWEVWWCQPRRGKRKVDEAKLTMLSPAVDMNPATCTVAKLSSGGSALYNGWNSHEDFYGLRSIVIGEPCCLPTLHAVNNAFQPQNQAMYSPGLSRESPRPPSTIEIICRSTSAFRRAPYSSQRAS